MLKTQKTRHHLFLILFWNYLWISFFKKKVPRVEFWTIILRAFDKFSQMSRQFIRQVSKTCRVIKSRKICAICFSKQKVPTDEIWTIILAIYFLFWSQSCFRFLLKKKRNWRSRGLDYFWHYLTHFCKCAIWYLFIVSVFWWWNTISF